jgi:undecaprenyl diphosphate synthase
MTLYAFSEQNWARPSSEVETLMDLLCDYLESERSEIMERGIRLRAIGRVDRLPSRVRRVLDPLILTSAGHKGMTLSLALSYGGREEIADAARVLASKVATRRLRPEDIDEHTLELEMKSMETGPVDLLIRTGGEQRISNFLLWGAAYAELYFSPTLWPDYGAVDLYEAITAYQARHRRFGTVPSDVASPCEVRPTPSIQFDRAHA